MFSLQNDEYQITVDDVIGEVSFQNDNLLNFLLITKQQSLDKQKKADITSTGLFIENKMLAQEVDEFPQCSVLICK